MASEPVAKRPSEYFGEHVRAVRERKRWNQQQLADRLAELGAPMDRATVARTETGARGVSIDDVFLFAAALNVSVEALVTPRSREELVQVAPERVAPAKTVREWMTGRHPLDEAEDARFYFMESPEETWELTNTPATRATALLEATILSAIAHPDDELRKLAKSHLQRELDRVVSEVQYLIEDAG